MTEQVKRKWQFARYGDDGLVLCIGCRLTCHRNRDRWFGWVLPARTVTAFDSVMNFYKGCNYQRAKLLKQIATEQRRHAIPKYKSNGQYGHTYYEEHEIELLVDGKVIANINGDYKPGMIKNALKPYTTRVGRILVGVGEADRVTN